MEHGTRLNLEFLRRLGSNNLGCDCVILPTSVGKAHIQTKFDCARTLRNDFHVSAAIGAVLDRYFLIAALDPG